MMLTFTFTINPETQEAVFAGNIEPQAALNVLQQLAIADAIKKARQGDKRFDIMGEKETNEPIQETLE